MVRKSAFASNGAQAREEEDGASSIAAAGHSSSRVGQQLKQQHGASQVIHACEHRAAPWGVLRSSTSGCHQRCVHDQELQSMLQLKVQTGRGWCSSAL